MGQYWFRTFIVLGIVTNHTPIGRYLAVQPTLFRDLHGLFVPTSEQKSNDFCRSDTDYNSSIGPIPQEFEYIVAGFVGRFRWGFRGELLAEIQEILRVTIRATETTHIFNMKRLMEKQRLQIPTTPTHIKARFIPHIGFISPMSVSLGKHMLSPPWWPKDNFSVTLLIAESYLFLCAP
jgi:hypothetical protein